MEKAKKGLWTPNANVVCYDCHGNTFRQFHGEIKVLSSEVMSQYRQQLEVEEGNLITICDSCKEPIQVYDSVAGEHNLTLMLQAVGINASMWQTGGMNSACGIQKANGKEEDYYLITYNSDGDNMFWLGSFTDGEYVEEFHTLDIDMMVKHIQGLKDVSLIK